jgi:glutathione S-transferase
MDRFGLDGRIRMSRAESMNREEPVMKLYYATGTCALSPHIVLREAGLPYQLERVDLKTKKLENGGDDFNEINPKGYVPVLTLDDGRRLTEGPAIVQYIADLKPESRLAPSAGTYDRYHLQEWLNFIGTEIHKSFSTLFNGSAPDEWKNAVRDKVAQRLDWIDKDLDSKTYLMGDVFTVADAYLYTVLRWAKPMGIDLSRWPKLAAYFAAVDARPRVREALKEEGLLQ